MSKSQHFYSQFNPALIFCVPDAHFWGQSVFVGSVCFPDDFFCFCLQKFFWFRVILDSYSDIRYLGTDERAHHVCFLSMNDLSRSSCFDIYIYIYFWINMPSWESFAITTLYRWNKMEKVVKLSLLTIFFQCILM